MTINEIQDKIIEEFASFESGLEKYEHITSLGKSLEPLKKEFKTEENLVGGCQSRVWFKAEIKEKKIYFTADSDSLITKGIISLVFRVVNNQSPQDILKSKLYFIDRIGLKSNLSPARGNGLYSVVNRIMTFAKKNL